MDQSLLKHQRNYFVIFLAASGNGILLKMEYALYWVNSDVKAGKAE
jgi:hypothetical protein